MDYMHEYKINLTVPTRLEGELRPGHPQYMEEEADRLLDGAWWLRRSAEAVIGARARATHGAGGERGVQAFRVTSSPLESVETPSDPAITRA